MEAIDLSLRAGPAPMFACNLVVVLESAAEGRKMSRPPDDQSEESPAAADRGLGISVSRSLRLTAAVVLGITLLASLGLIVGYLVSEKAQWEPAKFDIVNLVIFCFLGLAICLLPWEKHRLDIKKIGPFEFRDALSAQARERESELSEVWKRIEQLEEASRDGKAEKVPAAPHPNDLQPILGKFLADNDRWSFSPLRIKILASEDLARHDTGEIKRVLRNMVAEGTVETRVSKKGNTLYRIAKE